MTILDCSVTGCMYNEANCCHKGNIKVEGEDATQEKIMSFATKFTLSGEENK